MSGVLTGWLSSIADVFPDPTSGKPVSMPLLILLAVSGTAGVARVDTRAILFPPIVGQRFRRPS